MPSEFKGDPTPLQDEDYERAARAIGCTVAAVRAVAQVESRGGYLADGRPKILFERHKFNGFTGGQFAEAHSNIAWPSPGGYKGGAAEYDRLAEAIALDREAALKSASWGAFQIMGFNHSMVGFPDVESFVAAMVANSGKQLDAFVAFIKAAGLADELIRRDWAGFARGYNGPNYAVNRYDQKMAQAYALFSTGGSRTDNPQPLLQMGDKGSAVVHLQELLGITKDGDFGPATKTAVVAFQRAHGLYPDGIVGGQSWAALLANAATPARSNEAERSRPPLRLGDRGDDVAFLQQRLRIGPDGDFGPKTQDAVKKFQRSKNLTADGIVGRATWAALLAG